MRFRATILLLALSWLSLLPVFGKTTPRLHASTYLRHARAGVERLQAWYAPQTGLYNTTGWWNSANAITVLVDFMRVSGSKKYLPVLSHTFQVAPGTGRPGFLNEYYDDEGWWALAWIDAYDLTRDPRYLAMARSIFADMAGGWDATTCGGGIWWSKKRTYKNAIANELFLSVAAHLANRAANPANKAQYIGWANREWQWFQASGMINRQHLVNDGLTSTNPRACVNNGRTTWSYNQGVILGALVELHRADPGTGALHTASVIANAALRHLTDAGDVLHDTCEPDCGADGTQFKGIFVRNLMALNESSPDPTYRTFVHANADSIWQKDRSSRNEFGTVWSGPFRGGDASSQSSALDALVAAAELH
jgi:predicted alpha-1,6-mannanase (GH76 family)